MILQKKDEIPRINVEKVEEFVNKVLSDGVEGSLLGEWSLKFKNGKSMLEVEVNLKNAIDLEHTYNIEIGELERWMINTVAG